MSAYDTMPRTVRVGYKDYEIRLFTPVETMHTGRYGQHDPAQALIQVTAGLPDHELKNTLLHELLHAIWLCYNISDNSIGHKTKQEVSEEQIVAAMANGQLAVMRDNPKLFCWLLGV